MSHERARFTELDLFRYLTVTIAICAHIVSHHSIYEGLGSPQSAYLLNAVTRIGTPSLLILFGMMAEIVYARRFNEDRLRTVSQLIYRAFICYLAFVSIAFLEQIMVSLEPAKFVGALILVSKSVAGNIFKLYAIYLILLPIVLVIRQRTGLSGVLAFGAACWLVGHYIFQSIPELPRPAHHIGGLLLGIGNNWGPSVLQGMLLIVAGMVLGNALFSRQREHGARLLAAILLIGSIGAVAWNLSTLGWWSVVSNIADASEWRSHNHIGYFSYGLIATSVIVAISKALQLILPARLATTLATLGGATLPYFYLSNIILLLTPGAPVAGLLPTLAIFALYLVLFGGLTLAWLKTGRDSGAMVRLNREAPLAIANWLRRIRGQQLSSTLDQ